MDNTILRMFRAVARFGSISLAAEAVNSVPSNVSARVRKLEDELQAPLFHRDSRGMRLTPAGQVLLEYTERILALSDEARSVVGDMMGSGGVFRIACMQIIAAARLPPLLTRFHRAFPQTKLEVIVGTSQVCIEALLDRRADMAFVGGPVAGLPVEGIPAFSEELVVAAPVTLGPREEAYDQTLLAFSPGCQYLDCIDEWLEVRGGWKSTVLEFDSLDTVLSCIRAGMGVSILPRTVVERPEHAGQIIAIELTDAPHLLGVWLIKHKDSALTGAMREFQKMVG